MCDAECVDYTDTDNLPQYFLRSIESKTPGPAYQGKRIDILTHGGGVREEEGVCVSDGGYFEVSSEMPSDVLSR